ncbi:alcohol acetyltransferase-domain-containing protein [Cladorrhinum samala]|uniref:Alcohol acetyltransferase-domain-containing protein n=1 Tax=Cladorrhinum samala TaxID=585594 RepID=A0AAV9HGN3_9PEZI|nr:alcohol acetyltransferase-domain-containing protein [Cladorrhinum samala]
MVKLHLIQGDRDAPLLRILEKQHNQAWPAIASRPPWKTTVISYAGSATGSDSIDALVALDVVFAVHHSIADGRSTAAFHARLLSELTRMAESPMQLSGRVLSLPENPQFVRPLEEAVRFTQSWPFLLRILWREFAPAWLQPTLAATWTGGPITREPCQTNLRLVVLPANRARKVLAACREHQTTLTPLLHALTLISLTKHVPAEVAGAFSSSTPIDLRPFMEHDQPSQDAPGTLQFGVLVTTQQHRFEAPVLQSLRKNENVEDTLWRVAAELRSEMKRRLEGLPGDDIISMLGWISDWRKFWLTKLGKQRETTWEVSNIGSMVGSSEDANGWRIERSIMSQGATVSGAAIGVNVAGISKGDPFSGPGGSFVQTRAKSNVMRQRDQGVVVRLLQDIPKFGRKDAIFRVERGRMRNEWFPKKKAEYMTAARFKELGMSRKADVGERDPSFGAILATEDFGSEPAVVVPEAKSSLATSAEKAHTLLSILIPETLTFYRKPIPATTSSNAAPAAEGTAGAGTDTPLAIFGSVSIVDVINHIKGLLALDQEGSRVALEPANIQIRGLEQDSDRIKTLGRYEVYISVDSTKEPVVKVIEVLATSE